MLLFISLLIGCVLAAREADRVHSLPGWLGQLPSKQYSGLVDIGVPPSGVGRMLMHYWFIESEGNPQTDPLIVWYNGGPGASSMYGFLVELGPLWLNDLSEDNNAQFNATGVPQLIQNPWAWTKLGSLLMVDNSPPVGFSYCTQYGPTGNGTSCGPWNDTSVAVANAQFFENWFKLFPEFKKNELFFTGESYAGVYVPTIVREILSRPENGIKIAGVAIGDGCLGIDVLCDINLNLEGPYWDLIFFYGHGQLPNSFFTSILQVCTVAELKNVTQSPACAAQVKIMYSTVAEFFSYNLMDYCPENVGQRKRRHVTENPVYNLPINGYPCGGSAMNDWVSRSDVRQALNVPVDSFFFNSDNGNDFVYHVTERDVRKIALNWVHNTNMRLLIYNGDTDPSLSSFRTQDAWFPFFEANGVKVTQNWRAWTMDGNSQDVRGYVQEWINNRVAYLTIRGSGHMVPEFRSQAIFAALSHWINGTDYPQYSKPSSSFARRRRVRRH